MNTTNTIKCAYVRHYTDNDQTTAYVEWSDGSRTEGKPESDHMLALMDRARRDGMAVKFETW